MNIEIICIGKLKEKYWRDAVEEYSKRLSRYCTLSVKELKEVKLPENASISDEKKVIEEEGYNIIKSIKSDMYVIALDIQGIELDSEELSEKIEKLGLQGHSKIAFIIGGSMGLSQDILKRADLRISFSLMTFPHQMMRVILLEQIYRSFKIMKNEIYHK